MSQKVESIEQQVMLEVAVPQTTHGSVFEALFADKAITVSDFVSVENVVNCYSFSKLRP